MNYLITRKDHFKDERLSKYLKTTTIGSYDNLFEFSTVNEIMVSNLITQYIIEKKINNEIVISFNTKSNIKYMNTHYIFC